MTLNPLIPHLPAFLSFLIYGWMTGGLFAFGRRGGHGCLFRIGFWYFYAVWVVFFVLLLTVQVRTNQLWFLAGFLIPQGKHLWHHSRVQMLFSFLETLRDFIGRGFVFLSRTRSEQQKNPATDAGSHQRAESPPRDTREAMQREQARREAEARARREQAERERQEKARHAEPPREDAKRTPEQILGLKPPWTPEDLQTAYRREAGRTHPDKWIGKPESIRQAMEAEYKLIQEAYRILKR